MTSDLDLTCGDDHKQGKRSIKKKMRNGVRNLHGKGDFQAKRVLDFRSRTRFIVFQMYMQNHILK